MKQLERRSVTIMSNGLNNINEKPKAIHRFFMISIDKYSGATHFPEPKVTSSNCLFCPIISPIPKDTMIYDKIHQMEQVIVWHFCLINDLNNYISIFCFLEFEFELMFWQ